MRMNPSKCWAGATGLLHEKAEAPEDEPSLSLEQSLQRGGSSGIENLPASEPPFMRTL